MKMCDMITYLETRGFKATKFYFSEEKVYKFRIYKDGIEVTREFTYPDNVGDREKDEIQRKFLEDLIDDFNKAHVKSVYIVPAMHAYDEWLKENPCIQYAREDVEATMDIYNKMSLTIKDVIFHEPATIIYWMDGTKTVVKCQEGDTYDPEKGLAMAITKKALGNKGNYCYEFRRWIEKYYAGSHVEPDAPIGQMVHVEQDARGLIARLALDSTDLTDRIRKAFRGV